MLCHQGSRTLHLVHRNPADFEAERLKLRLQDLSYGTHTLKIFGAAIDLD